MAATQRLELRQSQSLVMTPQLQQAIKLLQFSNMDLAAYIDGELERNPLLERDEDDQETFSENKDEGEGDVRASDSQDSLDLLNDADYQSRQESGEGPLDTDYENLYNHDSGSDLGSPSADSGLSNWSLTNGSGGNSAGSGGQSDDFGLEQSLGESQSLRQFLTDQMRVTIHDPTDRIIALHLIDMVNEAGYLIGDLEALASQLGCPVSRIEATLYLVQGLEPTGVFARNLEECLSLQLAELDRLDPAMQRLLENLELLAQGELAQLQRICGVDQEDFSDMLAEIRALNPKPAAGFDQEPSQPLIPDVTLRLLPNNKWLVELNSETLPRVLVNQSYYGEVTPHARRKDEREYLSEHLQQANWLVKALHQRATTILKVSREIVRQQDGFFRKGIYHLKPLTLKDIAEAVELHESTVSRVTSNKFMATPRGIFELKYFFTAAIAGVDGARHSAESIRHRVRKLIDSEPANKILSDDSIVELLRGGGVDIARRTVAKYREAMKIPSSVQRRRAKAARI